MLDTVCLFKKV